MFCSVKSEAVSTAVNTFSQICFYIVLNFCIFCVEVGQTAHTAVSDTVTAAVVDFGKALTMPAVCVISDVRRNGSRNVIFTLIAEMVGDYIDNDMNAVFMCFLAHCGKFGFCTESGISRIVDSEVGRLIVNPPYRVGFAFCTLFCLLDNRGLNRGITCLCNFSHIGFNVVEGPLPCMKNNALLAGVHQAVIFRSGLCIYGCKCSKTCKG